jgi:hypothetical protein
MFDITLQSHDNPMHSGGCPVIYAPWGVVSFSSRLLHSLSDLVRKPSFDAAAVVKKKKRFCAVLVWNCGDHSDSGIRVAFFDLLSSVYKQCDAISKCRRNETYIKEQGIKTPEQYDRWNNVGTGDGNGKQGVSFYDKAVLAYEDYKFVVGFENLRTKGYFTEKLISARLADTVPVYWGAPDIEDHVDPKSFVHCNFERPEGQMPAWCSDAQGRELKGDALAKCTQRNEDRITHLRKQMAVDPKVKSCIDHIKELDQDDEKFKKALAHPFLYDNKLRGIWDWSLYGDKVRMIMKAADGGTN